MSNYWQYSKGEKNKITDVPGLSVTHTSIRDDDKHIHTGVTVVKLADNMFQNKLQAAVHVINGFGKGLGTVQVEELGQLETPIVLTNTLSVGTAHTALTKYMLQENPDIGENTGTVNPLVLECNDGEINDIRGLHITETDVASALKSFSSDFEEGDVGAGSGMICYDLKGGIGSASRLIEFGSDSYIIGVLVLSNFGSIEDLCVKGRKIGLDIKKYIGEKSEDKGSIITLIATDAPLCSRQLKRMAKRAQNGIARTGAYTGHGSGEIVLAFSTANRISHYAKDYYNSFTFIHEDKINRVFKAATEAVEEAILSSLLSSQERYNKKGKKIHSLNNWVKSI